MFFENVGTLPEMNMTAEEYMIMVLLHSKIKSSLMVIEKVESVSF